MSDLSLYLATVLIWGSTWFAIKLQLGVVPPAVSVTWRFLAAAAMLFGYAVVRRLPLRFSQLPRKVSDSPPWFPATHLE